MSYQAIRSLQQWLNNHGARLRVDGIIGPLTRGALRRFQAQAGVPVTGAPDQATVAALTRPPMPNPRPPPDVLGTGNTNFMPRPRPPPDVLGTGNTNFQPRLRPGEAMPVAAPPMAAATPSGLPFDAADNLDMAQVPGTQDYVPNYLRPAVNAASLAHMIGPAGGAVAPAPAAAPMAAAAPAMPTATDAQRAAATAALYDKLMRPPAQPWQPTPANPGYGLPWLPPQPTVWDALMQAGGSLGGLFGLGGAYGAGR